MRPPCSCFEAPKQRQREVASYTAVQQVLVIILCHSEKFLSSPAFAAGLYMSSFSPQQLEKLGVLPIKLQGGLGQPPETKDQVPRGSAYRFHS